MCHSACQRMSVFKLDSYTSSLEFVFRNLRSSFLFFFCILFLFFFYRYRSRNIQKKKRKLQNLQQLPYLQTTKKEKELHCTTLYKDYIFNLNLKLKSDFGNPRKTRMR